MVAKKFGALLSKNHLAKVQLRVQVFQGPALQCEYKADVNHSARLRIGKSKNIELPLPYSLFPTDVVLFSVTKWGARVHLDPRIDGFVSDGQRFGEVRDFIAPRGALKELASVLEPLEVPIPLGSRGALEIGGYTVVFRVDREKPKPQKMKVVGAPKAPFALPESHSALEKTGFLLGAFLTILVTIPAVQWLNKAPLKEFKSLGDLSPFLAAEIIHPDHFQILPWVFGKEFSPSNIVPQSIQWVDELRRKWRAEDEGLRFEAVLPPLSGFSLPDDVLMRRKVLQQTLENEWRQIISRRDTALPGTFLKGQTAYAPMRVTVSGGERGSLSERVRARLEKLDRTRQAVVSLIETEHVFMKEHFGTMNAEIPQIFDPPKEPGLFFRLAESSFTLERDNFHLAESFAALARKKQKIERVSDSHQVDEAHSEDALVWAEDSLTIPHTLTFALQQSLTGNEGDLLKNAKLSTGTIAPPPAPKLVPKIDMREVEIYVRGRSAEVKSCYDDALGRNPRIGGAVIWRWTIAENGRVANSKVARTTISDGQFLKCLDKKIKAWNFPRPQNGPISISFPFRFVVRENMETLERISR